MQYGKDQKEVRHSVQDPDLSGDRVWGHPGSQRLPRVPASKIPGRGVACQVRLRLSGEPITDAGQAVGAGSREAQGEGRRADDDHRPSKKSRGLETPSAKRRFVDRHREQLGSVSSACRAVGLALSSFYYRSRQDARVKARQDADLRDRIEEIQAEFPAYGYRRVRRELKNRFNLLVNDKRVRRIMKEFGLKALIWRGFKVKTTDSRHNEGYAPNRVAGRSLTSINQVWVADITYIRVLEGFVYLAAILDLYSRKVVGWAISTRIDHELCLRALDEAISKRRPEPGLVHHSDRGVQYACGAYRDRLAEHGILPSMGAKGYAWDNAFMESWFKTLKAEEVYLTEYETIEDVLKNISRFIEGVYNTKRMHSSLGYLSPDEFERLAREGRLQQHGLNPVMIVPH